jgi:pyruvate dehydrogenase E2 component (dihydrolipoamide acetyltransferase)
MMATPVKMPQLGVTMTEAKLLRWLKAVGEPVEPGEPLAEIETDKLSTEVAATAGGVLRKIIAAEGAVVPVTGLLAVIGRADEPASDIDALVAGRGAAATAAPPTSSSVRATPLAKRLAAERGLDLEVIGGSGPGGRITEADVRASAAATAPGSIQTGGEGADERTSWEHGHPRPPRTLGADTMSAFPAQGPGVIAINNVASADGGFVRASPLARRLAREHGLNLQAITGSGPEGRVLERDVLTASTAKEAAAEPRRVETIKVDGMRRLIGERLLRSVQTSAQLTLTTEADATSLVELRGHLLPAARVYGHRPPTYTDLLVHLVARLLPAHPLLNSSLLGQGASQEIACWADVNIGVAVALERGLVVPVVRNADQKALDAVSADLGALVDRARAGTLAMDDLQGGTFTITNLGAQEVDAFTPIINPPQCAILGVGRIVKKPAVVEDQIVVRQLLTLSLTFDHRIVDGAPAAKFLRDVKRAIERVLDETGGQDRRG